MKNLKWVGISLGGLTVLIIVVGSILHLMGQNKLNFAPTVTIANVNVASDQSTLERGQHLATISSCNECHGNNFEGKAFVNEAPIGYLRQILRSVGLLLITQMRIGLEQFDTV